MLPWPLYIHWAIPFNKGTPHGWFFSVCPRGYRHARITLYSLVNFSKFYEILHELLSVLGCQDEIFVPLLMKSCANKVTRRHEYRVVTRWPSQHYCSSVCLHKIADFGESILSCTRLAQSWRELASTRVQIYTHICIPYLHTDHKILHSSAL